MKTFKTTLLTIAALLCSISASAHDFKVDGIYYNITSSEDLTVEVTCYKNFNGSYSDVEITIPERVTYENKTYSVTGIGKSAFSGCTSLTSITIPNSVTSIGDRAFYNCKSLTSITIPNSVTSIGGRAFYGCTSLTSITIPESVTSIRGSAFRNCN